MHFAIDHVFALLDRTLFNPLFAALIPVGLQINNAHKVLFRHVPSSLLRLQVAYLPPLQKKALIFLAATVIMRLNRYLNRRARNNGVSDKFVPETEIVIVTGGAGVRVTTRSCESQLIWRLGVRC